MKDRRVKKKLFLFFLGENLISKIFPLTNEQQRREHLMKQGMITSSSSFIGVIKGGYNKFDETEET